MKEQTISKVANTPEKSHRLLPKWFWFLSLSLVFVLSVIWHLPISPLLKSAEDLLPTNLEPLSFEASEGGLWQGQTQLSWAFDKQSPELDLGKLQWQQSPANLFGALSPVLKWQTQFGVWEGQVQRAWGQEQVDLQTIEFSLDAQNFLSWLAPFARVPFEVKADVHSKDMRLSWSPTDLISAIDGQLQINNLSSMGISMPPLTLSLSMPDSKSQQILWQISGHDKGWQLQGQGIVYAKPKTPEFGQYQGEVLVNAESAEEMPDFAHLFPQPTPTQAKLTLNGNLKQLRMP